MEIEGSKLAKEMNRNEISVVTTRRHITTIQYFVFDHI
jgi:hypothetical protein